MLNLSKTKKLIFASCMLALGIVLPLFTSQVKEIGDSLLPMHFPVMICGVVCGWGYGASIGFIMPFLRSVIFGMPPLYPNAVWMALELATYGLVIGLIYMKKHNKKNWWIYFSLICSMLCGRMVWGIAKLLLLSIKGNTFTLTAFITGGFVDAFPGIVLQIVLIPLIIIVLEKFERRQS